MWLVYYFHPAESSFFFIYYRLGTGGRCNRLPLCFVLDSRLFHHDFSYDSTCLFAYTVILLGSSEALSPLFIPLLFLCSPVFIYVLLLDLILRTRLTISFLEAQADVRPSPVSSLWFLCFDTVLTTGVSFLISWFAEFQLPRDSVAFLVFQNNATA